MNPALPLLLGLSLAGFLFARRRRDLALVWLGLGLAASALLWPALRLSDGIPSPAASLAAVPPWQDPAAPAATHDHLRDVTFFVQPWLVWARSELRAGRLPLWNPHQLAGSPFWSNGQAAPLFPLHLLFDLLPLQLGFMLLPWLRLMLGGLGSFLLARELGLSGRAASVAAVIYPLCGMSTSFLLFPLANSLCLVPWVLLAVERLAAGRSGWGLLGILAGAQLLSGHPETVAFTAVLSAIYLLVRGAKLSAWGHLGIGWGIGGMVAAVALLPFLFTLLESSKWLEAGPTGPPPLRVVFDLQLRVVLPELFGHPARDTWWGPFNYDATAVYAGALCLPLAIAGLWRARREAAWRGVAAVGLFSFLAAYQLPGIYHLLAALPVLHKALFHYFLLGVELALALLAAAGFEEWLAGRRRGLAIGGGIYLGLLGLVWWRFAPGWSERGLLTTELVWTMGGIAAFLALWLKRAPWPWVPAVFVLDLLLAHTASVPGLAMSRFYPRGEAIEFLAQQAGRVAGLDHALRPNAAMVYGLDDARGEDPLKLERYERISQELTGERDLFFEPIRRWDSPWLDQLGVRWVLAGPEQEAPDPSWQLAHRSAEARIYERLTALPRVRWHGELGENLPSVEQHLPGRWEVRWQHEREGLLVIAEAWDAGWRATIDGRPVSIERVDGFFLGVRAGPGAERLELRYLPRGFLIGVAVSLLGLGAITAEMIGRRRRRGA